MWKRLLLVVMILMLVVMVGSKGIVRADMPMVWEYDVLLSTCPVVGSTTCFTGGGYPNLSGNARIHLLFLSNSGDVDQVVTIYEDATSTAAASVRWIIDLPGISDHNGIFVIQWPFALPPIWSNFAVKKSSTGSDVSLYINYR